MQELTSIRVYITNYRCICPKLLMLHFSSKFFACKLTFRILCKVWMEIACILGTVAVRSPKGIRLRGISRVQFWVCFWYKTGLERRCKMWGHGPRQGCWAPSAPWQLISMQGYTQPPGNLNLSCCLWLTHWTLADAELHEECEVLSDKVD